MQRLAQRFSTSWLPRGFDNLDEPAGALETIFHLPGARVAVADYRVLRHDFPQLCRLSNDAIDDWLLTHAAWISRSQAHQTVVNSPIPASERVAAAFRPPHYGRSVIVEAPGGLLDLKGAGVKAGITPSHADHSNGLEYLGVAFGDLLLKLAIDEIFQLAAPQFWTVPIYAVLDLGFDITNGWRGTGAAGIHVRRGHRRPPGGLPLPATGSSEQMTQFEIEMTLRSYGLTSTTVAHAFEIVDINGQLEVYDGGDRVPEFAAGDEMFFRVLSRGAPFARLERVNVQLSRSGPGSKRGELLDFGHFHVRPRFDHPVCSTVSDRPFCLGPVMWPDHPAYIQPDPVLHVPAAVWHRPNLNEYCFELAERFHDERCTREELIDQLEKPLRALLEQWSEPKWKTNVASEPAARRENV
jgi:hypothetical protein